MARKSGKRKGGKPERMPRVVVMIAVVLMLVPGGIFFAKGALELADRYAGRTERDATLLGVEIDRRFSADGDAETRYLVRGQIAGGEDFEFDDRQVYDIANGRTPLPVRADVSNLSGRVLAVRSDFGSVDGVGGATRITLVVLGMGMGTLLAAVPFLLPWQPGARKQAKERAAAPPPVDWGALALVSMSALVIVGCTLAWDLLR